MDFTLVSAQRLEWGKKALDTLCLTPQVLRNSFISFATYTRAPSVASSSGTPYGVYPKEDPPLMDELPTISVLHMATTGHPEYLSTRSRYYFPA